MTRTVALADDAYDALAALKEAGESFSDLARRLAARERERWLFDRTLRVDMTDAETAAWKATVARARQDLQEPRRWG